VSILIRLPFIASETREMSRIPGEFDLTAVQGHPSWCQSKAHVRLPISH